MAKKIRFYQDENDEKAYVESTIISFNIVPNGGDNLTVSIETTEGTYDFHLSCDDRCPDQGQMKDFLKRNLSKVLNGVNDCEISTDKDRDYVHFRFYDKLDGNFVKRGQFTGEYV